MPYFKTPEQLKAARLKEKTHEEKVLAVRKNAIKVALGVQKDIMPYLKQYNGLLFNLEPVNTALWRKVELYHKGEWALTGGQELKYDVTNQLFVYHIGLANLATHIQSIVESIHSRPEERAAILQRFVPLQFGKKYPELDCELNHVLSFADEIGKKHVFSKGNIAESIKIAVKDLQDTISRQNKPVSEEQKQRLSDYMDGCIIMMLDLYVSIVAPNPEVIEDIPRAEDFLDGRKRTLGKIFDDYLTYRSEQKRKHMIIQNYFDYCDEFTKQWINNDLSLLKKDPFLAHQEKGNGLLTERYFNTMPEPFWGNPDKCSMVMINLNPAYKEGHDEKFSREKTKQLCPNGYSAFAKSFPILNEDSYNPKGKKWWEGRKQYIDNLVNAYPNKKSGTEPRRPFAIEICPWQTEDWSGTKINIGASSAICGHIAKSVIEPAIYAIEHSQVDFALAIGKPILEALVDYGFKVIKSWGPETDDPRYRESNTIPVNYPTTKKVDDKVTPANVFFKLLVKEQNGRLVKVLCIMKAGSNNVPGPDYRKNGVEQEILNYIASI